MKINLKLKPQDNSYSIHIGENLYPDVWKYVSSVYPQKKVIVFCDNNIKKYQLKRFLDKRSENSKLRVIVFPAGEKSKTTKMKESVESELLKTGFDRNSVLIAFGGGITGDLGGFIAATYYRGIPFIQVPTSLLAMVDSSIGGKVGVNHPLGKNMIGSFYQPKSVFIDITALETLPQNHLLNGFAEIIKTALIFDKNFFNFLLNNREKILNRNSEVLKKIIFFCCKIKAYVVTQDEIEAGLRKILNYGHTIGHAIEILTNFKTNHGFAIATGMSIENRISFYSGLLNKKDMETIEQFLMECHYKTALNRKIKPEDILTRLKFDKKSIDGNPRFVLLKQIGKSIYDIKVNPEIIIKSLY